MVSAVKQQRGSNKVCQLLYLGDITGFYAMKTNIRILR